MTSTTPPLIAWQPPPGEVLFSYDFSKPARDQNPRIPLTFKNSISVREAVFVHEQHAVPLQHHIDIFDFHSTHFVLFSPCSTTPISTIRLVPFTHYFHPEPGARFDAPAWDVPALDARELFTSPLMITGKDRKTQFHDGEETYVKLGRLCVVKEEREKRYADLLIQAALDCVKKNPGFAMRGRKLDGAKGEGREEGRAWKGLVCVHAQERAVNVWMRNGFVIDVEMGTWFEGGMRHFGMWRRLQVCESYVS